MDAAGWAAGLASGLLFGLSDSLVRVASRGLSPRANLLLSLTVGAPVLWLAALASSPKGMPAGALAAYALAGLLNFVAGRLLFYTSIAALGASTATVATSPTTALSALLAWPLLGEHLTVRRAVAVVLSSLAAYLAASRPSGRGLHGYSRATGVAAALGAMLAFAGSTLLVRYAARAGGDPALGLAVSYTAALPAAAAIAVASGALEELARGRGESLKAMALAALVVAVAQLARYQALARLPVAVAVVLIGLYPIHTVAFTALLSKRAEEKPAPRHAAAAAAAALSIALAA